MKRIIAAAAALLVGCFAAQAQKMKLGEAIIFHAPDLKPDADTRAFEAPVQALTEELKTYFSWGRRERRWR